MTSYTPGPWEYSFESVDPEWAIVTTSGGAVIANVNADHRQEANARLIAASPELLQSLDGVLEWIRHYDVPFDQNPDWNAQKQCAYAAVAKARCQETANENI